MKVWLLAGLMSVVAIPGAFASEDASACGMDTRRDIIRADVQITIPGGIETQQSREVREISDLDAEIPVASASVTVTIDTPRTVQLAETPAPRPDRRRSDSQRVPDAVLIGGRGVL